MRCFDCPSDHAKVVLTDKDGVPICILSHTVWPFHRAQLCALCSAQRQADYLGVAFVESPREREGVYAD